MNVIFLYGPPAVGKLSVAIELTNRLNYKLLYNHMLINVLSGMFSFHNPSRRKLVREFRLRIIAEAIQHNINLIITMGTAGSPTMFEYYKTLIDLVNSKKGAAFMVHLTADKETLLKRVNNEFRKAHGKDFGKQEMKEMFNNYSMIFDKYPHLEHLTIDTRQFSPKEAAQQIIDHYKIK